MEVCAETMHVHKPAELGLLKATSIVVCHNFKIEIVNRYSIYKRRFEDINIYIPPTFLRNQNLYFPCSFLLA